MKSTLISGRYFRLAKEGSWIVLGQVVAVSGALVLVRVLTEYLKPTEYGELAISMTAAGLINQLVMGGVTNGIGRYYSIASEANDLRGYLFASRKLFGYAIAVSVAIGCVFVMSLFALDYERWIGLAVTVILFSIFSACNNILGGIQNAARQRAVCAYHGGLDASLRIPMVVGAIHLLGNTSMAVFMGYSCSLLFVIASQLYFLRRIIPAFQSSEANQSWFPKILAYSWPFSAWGLFSWMQQSSDRWALQHYATTADVGRYAVLFQLGYAPIALVTGLAMSFLGPILYQRSGNAMDLGRNAHVHELSWRTTYFTLWITLLGVGLTWTIHAWLFRYLVASDYRTASYLLPWVVAAGGLFAAGQMLSLKLMSEMKPASLITAKICTALLGLLCNVLGAAIAGMQGVVCGLVAFSAAYLTWVVVLARAPRHPTPVR